MLKRNIKQASTTVKSQAYKTIVRPQLEYASAFWDPHTEKDTHNLNKIQNHAARWVDYDYLHYTSVSSLQKQLNWPSLSIRRLQSRLVLFYKVQTTQHINTHIQIQLLSPNNHREEFTATQSVCDSNGAVLQGRPNPSSLPQPLIHTRTPLYITTNALSIHCK